MKKIALYGAFNENMLNSLHAKAPQDFEVYHVPAQSPELLADADYIVNRAASIDAAVLKLAAKARFIQKWGAGYDKIDVKAAGERGIPVAVCLGGNSLPVAELAVGLMLDVLRNVVPMALRLKRGEWSREQFSPRSYLLSGKTVGLVGLGSIAKKVAAIVKNGFGCEVLYYDVFRPSAAEEEKLGVRYVPLEELMAQSDIVSVHVPLLDSTRGMINRPLLERMKPTACIVNTSRGGVIDEPDLTSALASGKILGAGLDTFASEPLSADSPLLQMENVVTTPHCGGNTADNDINMAAICMECIARYDKSGDVTAREIVNREFLK